MCNKKRIYLFDNKINIHFLCSIANIHDVKAGGPLNAAQTALVSLQNA